jgi:hypothetical protein
MSRVKRRVATRRRLFLPFRNLGTRGRLELHAVRVDGRSVPIGQGPHEVVDLTDHGRPSVIELEVGVELPVELCEVLGSDERVPRDVRVVAIAEDATTWYRAVARLQPDAPPSLLGTLRLDGRGIDRAVTVRAVVCRASAAATPRPGLPEERGARLMETLPLTVQLRERPARVGSFLAVRWRAFSAEPALASWAAQPWSLQLTDPPVLWLNQEFQDLVRVLQAKGTTGARARLRDLMFRTIGTSCWPELFHAAAGGLRFDEDGAPIYAAGWHREALSVVAEWSYPELPRVQRLGRLIALLADARDQPAHLDPLLEEVALGTMRGLDLAPAVGRALAELGE